MRRRLFLWIALMSVLGAALPSAAPANSQVVVLSTTTSTQDSGLLDVLVPMFEKRPASP